MVALKTTARDVDAGPTAAVLAAALVGRILLSYGLLQGAGASGKTPITRVAGAALTYLSASGQPRRAAPPGDAVGAYGSLASTIADAGTLALSVACLGLW